MDINRQPNGTVIAVMVVWNGRPYLQAGVSSVLAALRPQDDMLIVDNGSTDGSSEYIQKYFPQVSLLQTHDNLGGAGGFNVGSAIALQSAQCEYVWLLDNDISVEGTSLLSLISAINTLPNVAAAGSQICLHGRPDVIQEVGAFYSPWLGALKSCHSGEKRLPEQTKPFVVDYLAACSLLIKSSVIQQHGLFKNIFIFYDDVEWGLRINKAGMILLAVPASIIYHNFNGLKPIIAWREYYRKRNRAVCLALHPPKKGKIMALWLFLTYLNYRIITTKINKDPSLHQAYKFALNDFLDMQLGRQNIPMVIPKCCDQINTYSSCYIIDIKSYGDTMDAISKLTEINPKAKFFISRQNLHRSSIETFTSLDKNEFSKNSTIAIVDDNFSLRTLLTCKTIYRYRQGYFELLSDSLPAFLLQWSGRFIGIIFSVFKATGDFLCAIKKYKNQSLQ